MDGILWILRTGAPWRDLPSSIGNWSSVWDAFDRWNSDGTLSRVLGWPEWPFYAPGVASLLLWAAVAASQLPAAVRDGTA